MSGRIRKSNPSRRARRLPYILSSPHPKPREEDAGLRHRRRNCQSSPRPRASPAESVLRQTQTALVARTNTGCAAVAGRAPAWTGSSLAADCLGVSDGESTRGLAGSACRKLFVPDHVPSFDLLDASVRVLEDGSKRRGFFRRNTSLQIPQPWAGIGVRAALSPHPQARHRRMPTHELSNYPTIWSKRLPRCRFGFGLYCMGRGTASAMRYRRPLVSNGGRDDGADII
jgi:hypothetical protein